MLKRVNLRTAWYGLIMLALILPVLVLTPWLEKQAESLLLDRAMLQEKLFHQQVATRLSMEARRITSVLQNKSDPMAHYLSVRREAASDALLHDLIGRIIQREPEINTLTVYDSKLEIRAGFQRPGHAPSLIDAGEPAIVIPMHGRIYIGTPGVQPDSHVEFVVAVPIVSEGKVAGVLVGTINVQGFWRDIRRDLPQHDSSIYLLDSRGALLAYMGKSQRERGDLLSDKPIVRALLTGKDWQSPKVYRGFEESRVFGIASIIDVLKWGIVSEVPSNAIMSPIIHDLSVLAVILFLLYIGFGAIAIFLSRYLFAPISELAGAVDKAAEGDYSIRVGSSRFLELDTLADGFNRMSRKIDERENSLKQLSQAIEQTSESILITNRQGIIEYVNPAFTRITGYTREEAVGNRPRMLQSGRQGKEFYNDLWQGIPNGEVWEGQLVNKKKNGAEYTVFMSISPIRKGDDISHFVCIQKDVSEQLLLEEQLRQAQKMESLGTLVGGIAHDFNNMLAGITGNLYLARNKVAGVLDAIGYIDQAEALAYRAGNMITQLLTFARKGIVQKIPLPLSSYMKEMLKLTDMAIPENIKYHISIDDSNLTILGDPTQIQQMLMNLLSNARDAVTDMDKPEITVSLKHYLASESFRSAHPSMESDQFACLTVRDNGHGISKKNMASIFEPFFTTKEVGKGSGLGLSMIYGGMQTHGGVIDVDSSEKSGTVFHLYFPLIEDSNAISHTEVDAEEQYGSGEMILVVDDESAVVEVQRDVLQALGYRVLTAANGEDGLAVFMAHQHEVALVLSDMIMSEMNGLQMARAIRSSRSDIPFVFATGYDKELLESEAVQENDIILSKPLSIAELSRAIQSLIR